MVATPQVKIGDWVKPANGWMPSKGSIYGKVVGEGPYSRLKIPCWLVDGSRGETKPEVCPKEAVELWWTAEEVEEGILTLTRETSERGITRHLDPTC